MWPNPRTLSYVHEVQLSIADNDETQSGDELDIVVERLTLEFDESDNLFPVVASGQLALAH